MKPRNVCRCCLVEGCYKDISTEYFCSGKKEVYADMLLNTFNIEISYQDGGGPSSGSRLICVDCITRLRDADAFKQQVLLAESSIVEFLKGVQKTETNIDTQVTELKVEQVIFDSFEDTFLDSPPPINCESSSSPVNLNSPPGNPSPLVNHDDPHDDDGKSDSELDLKDVIDDDAMDDFYNEDRGELYVIKLLPQSESLRESTRDDTNSTHKQRNGIKKLSHKTGDEAYLFGLKIPPRESNTIAKTDQTTGKKCRILKTPLSTLHKRDNTIKLILNSNMLVFKSLRIKYQCVHCNNSYIYIKELREHVATHADKKRRESTLKRGTHFRYADITDLACDLCKLGVENIEELRHHLTKQHDIQFQPEGHLLVPFRLGVGRICVLCGDTFNTFVRLLVHMNSHYSNHVCESCGQPFINKTNLRLHVNYMHKEQKCRMCQATFSRNSARIKHMRKVHDPSRKPKRYCLLCNKTFKYTYMLFEHRVKEHGEVKPTAKCAECNKEFGNEVNLRLHVRSVHLKERNYPCGYCTMRFFTSTDQRRHERTHSVAEADLVACSYCDTKFKSKDSRRRHVNKQHASLL